ATRAFVPLVSLRSAMSFSLLPRKMLLSLEKPNAGRLGPPPGWVHSVQAEPQAGGGHEHGFVRRLPALLFLDTEPLAPEQSIQNLLRSCIVRCPAPECAPSPKTTGYHDGNE